MSVSVPASCRNICATRSRGFPLPAGAGRRHCAAPCDAHCQRDRYERRQAFRYDRYRNADDRLKISPRVTVLNPPAVSKDQYAHCRDNNGDGIAELLDLTQERRLERADAASSRSMRPSSVSLPVATTTPEARPDTAMVPEKAMFLRSPTVALTETVAAGCLSALTCPSVPPLRSGGLLHIGEAQVSRHLSPDLAALRLPARALPPESSAPRLRARCGPPPTACCGLNSGPFPPCPPG